ncbi:MAG: type III-B CRISPR module RAMP protein Cmr6 [Anaerolineae bacterium]|nr:type III-B CRISPR module RAMP protein Cmr6 [Anaerolineae bacterium]
MSDYPLPRDTALSVQRFAHRCTNPGLLFDRHVPCLDDDTKTKWRALQQVQECEPDTQLLVAYRARWHEMVKTLGATVFEAETTWRFVTGLGGGGPLEVGFTFHRIHGFAVIPGSGLKGLARAWAHFALQEADPASKPEENRDFIAIFGCAEEGVSSLEARAGRVVFYEAIPVTTPTLDLDVMTPHYTKYYGDDSGRIAPRDGGRDSNPVPVPFLTVGPGVRFAFAVGWRGERDDRVHDLAVRWLKKGLAELGAGAKTAAGYGYFAAAEVG